MNISSDLSAHVCSVWFIFCNTYGIHLRIKDFQNLLFRKVIEHKRQSYLHMESLLICWPYFLKEINLLDLYRARKLISCICKSSRESISMLSLSDLYYILTCNIFQLKGYRESYSHLWSWYDSKQWWWSHSLVSPSIDNWKKKGIFPFS